MYDDISDVPSKVILDTNVYKESKYRFSAGTKLAQVRKNCMLHGMKLIIPAVVEGEIFADLKEMAVKIRASHKHFVNASFSIQGLENKISKEIKAIDLSVFAGILNEEYASFKIETTAIVLKAFPPTEGDILNRYFEVRPPFAAGKKNEFPDAFALAQIEDHVQRNPGDVAVVTNDQGWIDRLKENSHFKIYRKLENYLQDFAEYFDAMESLQEFDTVSNAVENAKTTIESEIISFLNTADFQIDSFNAEGEVMDTSNFSVFDLDYKIIEIDRDSDFVKINVTAKFSFVAEVKLLDVDSSFYDKEESRWLIKEYVDESLKQEFDIELEFAAKIDPDTHELTDLQLDESSTQKVYYLDLV